MMNKKTLTLLLLMLNMQTFAAPIDKLYKTLDSLILCQPKDIKAYQQSILNLPESERYEAYASFCYDSAYYYAEKQLLQATHNSDSISYFSAQLQLLHILSTAAMFSEAELLLNQLNRSQLPDSLYIKLLNYTADYWLYKTEFAHEPHLSQYLQNMRHYRQLLLQTAPHDSFEYIFTQACFINDNGNHRQAIEYINNELLPRLHSGERQYSIVCSTLAFFYSQLGDRDMEKYYYALSAISDFEAHIRENNSLRALALMLYQDGDIRRAWTYLKVSIEDAQVYGSRLRIYQTGQIAPIIMQAWQNEQTERQRAVFLLLIIALTFILLLSIAVVLVVVFMRRYHKANEEILKRNQEISAVNSQLNTSNKIQEEYLQRFMRLSSDYISDFEQNRRRLLKMLNKGQTKELAAVLNSPEIAHNKVKLFTQNFDEAFLNIYPNFINQTNQLLREDQQLELKKDERLTTELRILALIRLGINDNKDIAAILRSTLTTVYTYRSRLRLKAIDKEHFEEDIMLISSTI